MTLQEGVKVAHTTIEALKTQPVALAIIVVNLLFLGVAVWLFHEVNVSTMSERELHNGLLIQALTTCGVRVENAVEQNGKDLRVGFDQILGELKLLRPKN